MEFINGFSLESLMIRRFIISLILDCAQKKNATFYRKLKTKRKLLIRSLTFFGEKSKRTKVLRW